MVSGRSADTTQIGTCSGHRVFDKYVESRKNISREATEITCLSMNHGKLFTPQPLAARGIVMSMTGGQAVGQLFGQLQNSAPKAQNSLKLIWYMDLVL